MSNMRARQLVLVDTFTDGVLEPGNQMAGPVRDGGRIMVNTTAGCWGPMITPKLRGGHEVCQPVFLEGAKLNDAVAIRIESVRITSDATASGNDKPLEGRYVGDPFVEAKCPSCGEPHPDTYIEGIGCSSIRCKKCGEQASPFTFTQGYTMVFDEQKKIGVTVGRDAAEKIGKNGRHYMQTPENSIQNPAVTLAPSDIPGIAVRLRPFIGQLGTMPGCSMPDSHNAGDFGQFLLGAPHEYALTKEMLTERTDGHMDINKVREGAVLICPIKVAGAGIYVGDVHAMQGEGEIAGHTTDVCAAVILHVNVIPGLQIDGPILLPNPEDLPHLARPFSVTEKKMAAQEAEKWGVTTVEESAPLSFIGTGANLNKAIDNGVKRAAGLLDLSIPEIMNRVTISGAVEIGRAPGVVTVTLRVPRERLEKAGLWELVKKQYCL